MLSLFVSWDYMCYCCDYAGWSICDQAALISIRAWTYMVEQRHGHGPDQIIKQEHIHFITLIHQRTLGIQTTSLSLFVLFTTSCLSLLRWNSNLDHMKVMMHTQLPLGNFQISDTGETGSSCNSNFLILVLAF